MDTVVRSYSITYMSQPYAFDVTSSTQHTLDGRIRSIHTFSRDSEILAKYYTNGHTHVLYPVVYCYTVFSEILKQLPHLDYSKPSVSQSP